MGCDEMNQATNRIRETIEPLEALALLAWNNAPQWCHPEHGCQDYHRSWGLVRLLLGHGRLPAGEDFFARELTKVVRSGGRRVLVSGGADAGLLTIALKACRAAGTEPELVFADRCATACEVNARMAVAAQANVQIIQGDLCELDIAPVDAVLAHSFLPFFEGDKRQALLEAWTRNCQVGGKVLISNVLKADEADWTTIKDGEALKARAQKLRQALQEAGHLPEVVEEMVSTAERFWKSSPSRPPGLTEANLRIGLERAGFADISIHYSDAGVNDGPIAMVRKRLNGKPRAEISAVKRK
jgi:ubiquinone/menaquinone biosynthesis C-methylase UbiE